MAGSWRWWARSSVSYASVTRWGHVMSLLGPLFPLEAISDMFTKTFTRSTSFLIYKQGGNKPKNPAS